MYACGTFYISFYTTHYTSTNDIFIALYTFWAINKLISLSCQELSRLWVITNTTQLGCCGQTEYKVDRVERLTKAQSYLHLVNGY